SRISGMRGQTERVAFRKEPRHRLVVVALAVPAFLSVFLLAACAATVSAPDTQPSPVKEPSLSQGGDILMCQGVSVPRQTLAAPRPATALPAEVLSVLGNPLVGIEEPLSEWLIAHESAELVTIMHELEEP